MSSAPQSANSPNRKPASLDSLLQEAKGGEANHINALRLYLTDGIRWYLRRSLAIQDVEPEFVRVLDTIVAIVLKGRVESGDQLMALVRVALRTTVEQVLATGERKAPEPETSQRRVDLMKEALVEFTESEREALTLHCEGWQIVKICSATGHTENHFNELRSRLKFRYAQLSSYESVPVLTRFVILPYPGTA